MTAPSLEVKFFVDLYANNEQPCRTGLHCIYTVLYTVYRLLLELERFVLRLEDKQNCVRRDSLLEVGSFADVFSHFQEECKNNSIKRF